MKKAVITCVILAIAQVAWTAEKSRSFAAQPGSRFVVAATVSIDDALVTRSGCRIIRRVALNPGEVALVECASNPEFFVAVATNNKWAIRAATKYKDLEFRDSMLLALQALLNPESINKKKMSYFFPAKGDTLEQRQKWLSGILKTNSSGLSLVVPEKQGTYFGFTPNAVNPVRFLTNVNANYGVSVGSEDLPAFLILNPNERGNAQRIVGE